ncbi:glycosyltransferase family 2 protein [Planococcus shenhongbingii]|uniref:Glycosyltransferase n=1 Tax=Planococcus shenhongbingii TaxID=3058398 RepID=A0ABT8NAL9_9BACL|nr:glycosyltransferase [Planococcus sp. N017]MDN7244595.1 glycosyltransferase [Planococcus sp. N017]
MEKEIKVSIACMTYNHESYIAETIESFLMQETDFNYEILIHDDASTDRTQEIIRQYEQKYPDIIKPIYQVENQFSQNIIVEYINHRRAKGKYIAFCEGDDYWTHPEKLQKQVEYMEAHPETSMCIHAAKRVEAKTKRKIADIRPFKESKVMTVEEVIEGGGDFFATNSMIYSREKLAIWPEFYFNGVVGDYPMVIFGALQGEFYYMDEDMSSYRVNSEGSWTQREFSTIAKKKKHYAEVARTLDEIDEYTDYRYSQAIQNAKKGHQFYLLLIQGKFKEIRQEEFLDLYNKMGIRYKLTSRMKHYFPGISRLLIGIKLNLIR